MTTRRAALLFTAITLLVTWPLAAGLAHHVAGDFGDPLLNAWILAWDATHLFARGTGWWNANIFAPHPLALAYSEHLAAQAFQILPIYAVTNNPILAANLLLLSTFVLSGVGMFLLARELTGDRDAAFVAGLAYAFAPYRIASLPHLQVLSSAWMPFVLVAFRRYFTALEAAAPPGRGLLPLAWATLAWIAQNLSCGYYLLFFSPIVALYVLWELTTRGLWRNAWAVAGVAAAVAVVVAATVPFLLPYLELRSLGFDPRSVAETQRFSADVYGYFTADENLRVSGSIWRAWPRAEGSLFPGLTIVVTAAIAACQRIRDSRGVRPAILLAPFVAAIVWLLLGLTIRMPGIKITSLSRALIVTSAAAGGLLAASRNARASAAAWLRSAQGFFTIVTIFAMAMSFGPAIYAKGRIVLDVNVYAFFYRFVPGYDGLRVPARFAMIVALGLAALCGLALATIRRRAVTIAAALLIAVESFAAPIPIDQNVADYTRPGLAPLPALERTTPPVYAYVATLPPTATILELPLGEPAFDVRYMFFSTTHWRRLVNGYSGGRPAEYDLLDRALQDLFTRPERAWDVTRQSMPSHIVVHERYYADDRGPLVSAWVRGNHWREIAAFGGDRVFVR